MTGWCITGQVVTAPNTAPVEAIYYSAEPQITYHSNSADEAYWGFSYTQFDNASSFVDGSYTIFQSASAACQISTNYDCINGSCVLSSTYNTSGLYSDLASCQAACGAAACPTCPTCPDPVTCPTCPAPVTCPTCPAPVTCPTCETCPAPVTCPTCETCPAPVTCPTCETCPGPATCPTCPAPVTCPTCETCETCQTCPVVTCPAPTVCPACPDCPESSCPACPTSPSCPACPASPSCPACPSCAACPSCPSPATPPTEDGGCSPGYYLVSLGDGSTGFGGSNVCLPIATSTEDVNFVSISVPTFSANCDASGNPVFGSQTVSVIQGTESSELLKFQELAQIQGNSYCNIDVAGIPDSWLIRPEYHRPQVIYQFAEVNNAGVIVGAPKYPITVPHHIADKPTNPLPNYERGNWEIIFVLNDNSKVTIHSLDEANGMIILNAVMLRIIPSYLTNAYRSKSCMVITDTAISQITVKNRSAKYYSTGTKNDVPDWIAKW